jgi:hypothetical protein
MTLGMGNNTCKWIKECWPFSSQMNLQPGQQEMEGEERQHRIRRRGRFFKGFEFGGRQTLDEPLSLLEQEEAIETSEEEVDIDEESSHKNNNINSGLNREKPSHIPFSENIKTIMDPEAKSSTATSWWSLMRNSGKTLPTGAKLRPVGIYQHLGKL